MSNNLVRVYTSVIAAGLGALLLLLATAPDQPAFADSNRDCLNSSKARGADNRGCYQSGNLLALDHRCLSLCMAQPQNGIGLGPRQNGSSCMASCSYIKPEALIPPAPARSGPNSQFTQTTRADRTTIILPPPAAPGAVTSANSLSPKTQPLSPSTNYKCVAQCTQQGMTFGYCTQTCSY